MIKSKEDIISFIETDEWMMDILRVAKLLELPDWWICAGFVRSKIWDVLHNFSERTPLPDIDVIYFDPTNINEAHEKNLEEKLQSLKPNIPWSVKNQARMHLANKVPSYSSSEDAISKFPETATALGVTLDENDQLILTAPCGVHDVIHLEIKPTPFFTQTNERMQMYEKRVRKKQWKAIWDRVKVIDG